MLRELTIVKLLLTKENCKNRSSQLQAETRNKNDGKIIGGRKTKH